MAAFLTSWCLCLRRNKTKLFSYVYVAVILTMLTLMLLLSLPINQALSSILLVSHTKNLVSKFLIKWRWSREFASKSSCWLCYSFSGNWNTPKIPLLCSNPSGPKRNTTVYRAGWNNSSHLTKRRPVTIWPCYNKTRSKTQASARQLYEEDNSVNGLTRPTVV